MKAVGLLSGGLDSILALRMILDQGIEVQALNFVSVFCTCTAKGSSCSAAQSAVRQLGVPLKVIDKTPAILEVVKDPPHGYGSNMNPCLDCRILMFRRAHEHMAAIGASFLVTGEVLGERPMSQRRDAMRLIEREAGVEGLVVRPLSAALLEPSLPERNGWVDRDRLLAIRGRSRRPQIALARELGINDYPCPAGGCRLTDPGFAARMRDLVEHGDFAVDDVHLLKVGRHFRLTPAVKAVVGRNEEENSRLADLRRAEDISLEWRDGPGPLVLLRGSQDEVHLATAARLVARYCKGEPGAALAVAATVPGADQPRILSAAPLSDDEADALRVGG